MAKSSKKNNKKGSKKSTPFTIYNPGKGKPGMPDIPDVLKPFFFKQTTFAPLFKPRDVSEAEIKTLLSKATHVPPGSAMGLEKTKLDGSGSVVCILDTGVNDHNDLQDKIIYRSNYLGHTEGDLFDSYGHGTHLAGIVAGNRSASFPDISGIASGTKIVSIKVTDGNSEETTWYKIADGLEQAIHYNVNKNNKNKITAILIAFNAFDNVSENIPTGHHRLSMLISKLERHSIPVIVSAGNCFPLFLEEGLAYPAHMDNIIVAGSSDNDKSNTGNFGNISDFSQCIEEENKKFNNIFLCAPGKNTISCGIMSPSAYTAISGSSQAAAVMAGVIALMQQRFRNADKSLPSVKVIQNKLMNRAEVRKERNSNSPLNGRKYSHVDANNTLR